MSSRSGFSGKVFFIGVFIGIVIGLLLALFTAWKVGGNGILEVFNSKPATTTATATPPGKNGENFYNVLPDGAVPAPAIPTPPGKTDAKATAPIVSLNDQQTASPDQPTVSMTVQQAPATRNTNVATATPENSAQLVPTSPPRNSKQTSSSKTTYWLQVGSFLTSEQAESRRAELGLAGFTANILRADVPGTGVRYRVRMGPFTDQTLRARVKEELARNNFESTDVVQ